MSRASYIPKAFIDEVIIKNATVNNIMNSVGSTRTVANIVAKVDTITDLLQIDTSKLETGEQFYVLGYHTKNDGGGGIFYWDADEDKTNHNGGTIIDPTQPFPNNWSDTSQQNDWFTANGSGNGCWKRVHDNNIDVRWFGAKNDPAVDSGNVIKHICNTFTENITLIIDDVFYITSVVTIPENICLKFTKGGKLVVSSGYTVTINGLIEAGLWQIFDGNGVITGNPKIEAVYPEWFGAKGDGVTDDTEAIQKAFDFSNIDVLFYNGTYFISNTIDMKSKQMQAINTIFKYNGSGALFFNYHLYRKWFIFRNSRIDLTSASSDAIGILIRGMWDSCVKGVWIDGTSGQTGIKLESTYKDENDYFGVFCSKIVMPHITGTDYGIVAEGINTGHRVTHLCIDGGWIHTSILDVFFKYVGDSAIIKTAFDSCNKVDYHIKLEEVINTTIIPGESEPANVAYIQAIGNCAGSVILGGDRISVDNSSATARVLTRSNYVIEIQATNDEGYLARMRTDYNYDNPFHLEAQRSPSEGWQKLLSWYPTDPKVAKLYVLPPNYIEKGSASLLHLETTSSSNYFCRIGSWYDYGECFRIEATASGAGHLRKVLAADPENHNTKTPNILPFNDDSYTCGSASCRWKEIFAVNGAINTSDKREKIIYDIEQAEIECAKELKTIIKKFKWKDAIKKKGEENARYHFGVIAQEVAEVFEKYGLDAHKYGLFCYDEWLEAEDGTVVTEDMLNEDGTYTKRIYNKETGELKEEKRLNVFKRDRYGVRYEELFAFILLGIE